MHLINVRNDNKSCENCDSVEVGGSTFRRGYLLNLSGCGAQPRTIDPIVGNSGGDK